MKLATIYQAINMINNKSYIGQTVQNFDLYKNGHIENALEKNSQKYFHRAIRKYGKENFEWKILFQDYCHPNKLDELEIFFIAYYDTFKGPGYNMTIGGAFGDTLSKHPNKKEIFKKISKSRAKTMKKINPETGLNKYQEYGTKISQTKKKNGKNKESKYYNAKKYILIDANGKKYKAFGNIRKLIDKLNLSGKILFKNLNEKILKKNYKKFTSSAKCMNTIGWRLVNI